MRASIVQEIGSAPTMAKTMSAAGRLDRLIDDAPAVRWAILRNITVEPGLPAALKVASARRGMAAHVQLGEFNSAQNEARDAQSFVYTGEADIVVVAMHLQTLAPRLVLDFAALTQSQIDDLVESVLERVIGIVEAVRRNSSALILVHNFELPVAPAFGILDTQLDRGQLPVIRGLNLELASRLRAVHSAFVVDVDHLLSVAGYEASLDERYWHIGRAPYTFTFIERLARTYVTFAAALRGRAKKCLVLDCDNTLWGGVIGEDGIDGIALGETYPGSAFVAFHSAILTLYNRGVLLALNSKNNEADAMAVFKAHPSSLLKPEHFVALKINWEDKVTNLRNIASDLNIGLDSLVFVDDNAFECQYVRERLPEVAVIELPGDVTRYASLLRNSGYFDTLTVSEEDRRRSEMYRSEARRSQLKASTGSLDQYLASLNMVLTISRATPFSVPRIAQLTQKTNQFNLTTRRYSEGEIQERLLDSDWHVYFAELEDKFDKSGIIAVALIHDSTDSSRIDTLLMSCRVIGRGVEAALIAHIARSSAERGKSALIGEFVPTAKNMQVENFYGTAGFTPQPGPHGQWWRLDLRDNIPAIPTWFVKVEHADVVPS